MPVPLALCVMLWGIFLYSENQATMRDFLMVVSSGKCGVFLCCQMLGIFTNHW